MTFGLDVIYEALMLKGAIISEPPVDLYIIPVGTQKACLKLATELRSKGLKVDVEMADRRLKKSLTLQISREFLMSLLLVKMNWNQLN